MRGNELREALTLDRDFARQGIRMAPDNAQRVT